MGADDMGADDKLFAGSIPAVYDRFLVPLIFEPYARDLAERIGRAAPRDLLETAAGTGVLISALTREFVSSGTVGIGVGLVGLAGAVSVAEIDTTTESFVSEADVFSQTSLDVLARNRAEIQVAAGIIGGGLVGLGATIGVTTIDNTTLAHLTGANTNARGRTQIDATSTQIIHVMLGTVGAGLVGVAGTVAVSAISSTTEAFSATGSRLTQINQNPAFTTTTQDVLVEARDTASIDDDTGSIGLGLVGAGAAVDVATIKNSTTARIGASTRVSAGRGIARAEVSRVARRHEDVLLSRWDPNRVRHSRH